MCQVFVSRFKPAAHLVLVVGFLFFIGALARGNVKPDRAPPELISTDGGAPKWKNTEQLKSFAAQGVPKACLELADLLLEGTEVARDVHQAAALFAQAAKGGEANGWFRLGKIAHDGLDGPVDLGRALDYFTLAARSGVAEAQHNLGAMLVSGRGVKRNYVEGLAWLIVAVKSGVGADTETQVRNRLAKRPNEIIAAESRADELVKDLAYATVQAGRLETTGKIAARTPTQTRTPPTISRTVEKPVVAFPGAPEIIFPVASGLELPSAPVKKP